MSKYIYIYIYHWWTSFCWQPL